jgi:mobilome CxxCx(11)CxxC protein
MGETNLDQFEEDTEYVKDYTDESDAQQKERLINWCNRRARKCLTKAWIFDERRRRYKRRLKVLTFSGVAGPAVVGTIVLSFAVDDSSAWFKYVLTGAGLLSIARIVLALWALPAKWDDAHAYASEAASANRSLYRRYILAASFHPKNVAEFRLQFDQLAADYQCRRDSDDKQTLTEEELERGRKWAEDYLRMEDDVDLTHQTQRRADGGIREPGQSEEKQSTSPS